MNLDKKLIYRILLLSSGFLLLAFGISGFLYWRQNETRSFTCATKAPISFCGTVSPILSEKAQKGKNLFNSNCAACHKLRAKATGPALSQVDSTKLWNWMTDANHSADSTKFSRMKKDYHKIMWGKSFTENQLDELLEYIKVNANSGYQQ